MTFNRPNHFEIHATDTEKLADFYREVFGWEVKKWDNPNMDYYMVMTAPNEEPGAINGGIIKRVGPPPAVGQCVNGYVCTMTVENIDEMMEKVKQHGGTEAVAKSAIPGFAWLAYFRDIDENIFGMIQNDTSAK